MNKYKWIKENGITDNGGLLSLMSLNTSESSKYIAMYTNRFCSGNEDELSKITAKDLLEIRIFDEETEFMATRGSIGEEFQWRVTDDKLLEQSDRIVINHFIDINEERSGRILDNGNMEILSTVGGIYSLPIDSNMKRIKIMQYISYDDNGMAKIADSRICGFVE